MTLSPGTPSLAGTQLDVSLSTPDWVSCCLVLPVSMSLGGSEEVMRSQSALRSSIHLEN